MHEKWKDTDTMSTEQLQDELEQTRQQFSFLCSDETVPKDRFHNFVDKTPAGICITNEAGFFEYVNPAYCEIYQYKEEELLGQHFTMVVPEEYREQLNDLHRRFVIKEHDEVRGEWSVQRKDGKVLTILADAALLVEPDGSRRKATFVQDITARKQVEELRERVQRITRHDLKTPLNAVINLPDILLMEDNLSQEQREMIEMIREAGYRMLETINLSHDLFRMETQCYELQPRPLNLVPIVQRVLRELQPLSNSKKLQVEQRCESVGNEEGPFIVQGEELLCYSMLANLLKNAMEASPREATIALYCSVEQQPKAPAMARIEIVNRGVVPNELRDCFFEKYTTHGKREGTGLGTYSARLIAETQGGQVLMQTDDATDSTNVTIRLPV